ncbi:putative meiosis-specific protein SPO11 like protein [Nosema granulosis]|uniref:DNA topoisomerase (ATP-hydrolyzing) n=1 Tax=Nosema granulosis TaxID=83296 RepID=A0A9P6H1I2_9MICR|nr:putative meiosis-specific protein SPO11 like protein [Nosema granulosis]
MNILSRKIQKLTITAMSNIKSQNILSKLRFYEIVYEMITKDIIRNKREIYYLDVPIFKTQKVVDRYIKEICRELKVTAYKLNITNTLKGIFYGSVQFDGGKESTTNINTIPNTTTLIPDMNRISKVTTEAKLCVVVEKDTIFSKIVRSSSIPKEWLVVCGKGYPCFNTQMFLSRLENVKIVGLFDYDPYGLDIFLKYLKICKIEKIGLEREDVEKITKIDLNLRDISRMKNLRNYKETYQEIKEMEEGGVKAELEGIFEKENIIEYINRKVV